MTELRIIIWDEHVKLIDAKRDVRMVLFVKRKVRPGVGGSIIL
jgi:hypothetical protein